MENKAAWDEYDVYLFDIDGTLMNCTDAVHYFAFCDALSSVAGRPLNLDGVVTHGSVDIAILRDAWRLCGVAEEVWRPRLAEVRTGMCRFVEERVGELRIIVLSGVVAVLEHLRGKGAVLGVATGNLAGIGRVKLGRAGLLRYFDFGGYSDAFESRREVFAGALAQGRALTSTEARVCVVGDTPEDVRAAKANGLDVIAVATGIFRLEELRVEAPDWCVRSLDDLPTEPGRDRSRKADPSAELRNDK